MFSNSNKSGKRLVIKISKAEGHFESFSNSGDCNVTFFSDRYYKQNNFYHIYKRQTSGTKTRYLLKERRHNVLP